MRFELVRAGGSRVDGQPRCRAVRQAPGQTATRVLLGAVIVVLSQLAAPSHAAEPAPAKGASASKAGAPSKAATLGKAPGQSAAAPAGEPLLTRDQLRQCLRQEEDLKTGNGRLVELQSSVKAEGKALTEAEAALQSEREGVDATNAEAVAAFNARLAALRERADTYRTRAQAFNDEVGAHQTRHQAWVADCGGRSYDEIDYFAIQRGK